MPINQRKTQIHCNALSRICPVRVTDNHEECKHRLAAFGLFRSILDGDSERDHSFKLRVARALRSERRAARAGASGYDPMRHLILARLDRKFRERSKT